MNKVKSSFVVAAGVLLLGLASIVGTTVGADAGAARSTHPYVGTWMVQRDHGATSDRLGLARISADGSARFSGDTAGLGAWEPTGPNSATLVYVRPGGASPDETDELVAVRMAVDISEDGTSLSGTYAVTIPSPIVGDAVNPSLDVALGSISGERVMARPPRLVGPQPECSRTQRIC